MSDRYAAQITIGGEIQQKDLTGLFKAITYEGISTEWDGDPFQPQHEKEIRGVLNKDGQLRLCDTQASDGRFPDLEQWLIAHRISFTTASEAKYENEAVVVEYRPTLKQLISRAANNQGDTLILYEGALNALIVLKKKETEKATHCLEHLLRPIVEPLPPLTLLA
jgi:hypothetical protein